MKISYTLESPNQIINDSKVEIRGKDAAEIAEKKAIIESQNAAIRLIPRNNA